MCRSMVDIQSATAPIRRGKKKEGTGPKYNVASATQGGHKKLLVCTCGFYSVPQCSHCKRCRPTSYSNSVRPSHAGIVSKRLHVARCSLHCQIAKLSSFLETKKYSRGTTPSPEILVQTDLPLLIAASLDTFCLVAPQR